MDAEMIAKSKKDIEGIVECLRMVGCCEMGVRSFANMAYKIETPQDFKFAMEFAGTLWDSRNGHICFMNSENVKKSMKEFEERNKR